MTTYQTENKDDTYSSLSKILFGVTQGSILGSLLFKKRSAKECVIDKFFLQITWADC